MEGGLYWGLASYSLSSLPPLSSPPSPSLDYHDSFSFSSLYFFSISSSSALIINYSRFSFPSMECSVSCSPFLTLPCFPPPPSPPLPSLSLHSSCSSLFWFLHSLQIFNGTWDENASLRWRIFQISESVRRYCPNETEYGSIGTLYDRHGCSSRNRSWSQFIFYLYPFPDRQIDAWWIYLLVFPTKLPTIISDSLLFFLYSLGIDVDSTMREWCILVKIQIRKRLFSILDYTTPPPPPLSSLLPPFFVSCFTMMSDTSHDISSINTFPLLIPWIPPPPFHSSLLTYWTTKVKRGSLFSSLSLPYLYFIHCLLLGDPNLDTKERRMDERKGNLPLFIGIHFSNRKMPIGRYSVNGCNRISAYSLQVGGLIMCIHLMCKNRKSGEYKLEHRFERRDQERPSIEKKQLLPPS